MSNINSLESRIIIEINFNVDNDLIYKINKIATELEMPLNEIIEKAISKLINDIEFVRSLRY